MPTQFVIRKVSLEYIPDFVFLRRIMFQSMGYNNPDDLNAHDHSATQYLLKTIPSGEFHGWLATTFDGKNVGSGGVVIDQHPPSPVNLTGKIGYIMSIITLPEYRGKGIARQIMEVIIDWLKGQKIQVVELHATEMGRQLYASMGFLDTNVMRMKIA
ncbi:MAG: N-acetyltransferase [Promethearchaeota archaeon CR_4]|nr:MAG: N-acetyltransferase [Candidatus Lokiarchaeota archaeon CR_4]